MVSILEGQLTRTWIIMTEEKKNTINLYHDTITGVRSAILNFEEIHNSLGISNLLTLGSIGHQIEFKINNIIGYIKIKRNKYFSEYIYSCYYNNKKINEITENISLNQEKEIFHITIEEFIQIKNNLNFNEMITWYDIKFKKILFLFIYYFF